MHIGLPVHVWKSPVAFSAKGRVASYTGPQRCCKLLVSYCPQDRRVMTLLHAHMCLLVQFCSTVSIMYKSRNVKCESPKVQSNPIGSPASYYTNEQQQCFPTRDPSRLEEDAPPPCALSLDPQPLLRTFKLALAQLILPKDLSSFLAFSAHSKAPPLD
jgi:hypothetical protein